MAEMAAEPIPMVPDIRRANKAQLAEFFGVTLPAVEAWVRKGAPFVQRGSKGVGWIFDLNQVAQWYYDSRSGDGNTDPDKLPATERKAWYEGEGKKRDLQIRDRELIECAEVERVVATAFAAIAADLRAIPDDLERRHGIDAIVAEQVEAGIFAAMDGLADRLQSLAALYAQEDGD